MTKPRPERRSLRAVPTSASVMHLRCPACHEEALFIGVQAFDQRVSCDACGASSEVRHAHETWCAAKREILNREFPELLQDDPPVGERRS